MTNGRVAGSDPLARTAKAWAIANMVLFGAFWALYLSIAKQLPGGYSIFEVLWGRYALHVLLTLLVIGQAQPMELVKTTNLKLQLLRGLLMAGTSIAAVLAASAMSLDEVRLLLWLAPFVVISLDRFVRRTPIPKAVWLACALCWGGALSVLHPGLAVSPASIVLALIAAAMFGGYQLMTAYLRSDPATTSVFYSGLVSLLVMSVTIPFVWRPPTTQALLVYLGMGVAGWLSLLFLDKALHVLEPGRVVVYGYSHLIASVIVSSIATARSPALSGLVGSILIAVGVIVAAAADP